jgi:cell division protein FtsZ
MSILEVNRASDMITEAAGSTENILFGTAIDEKMGDMVRVMIIATDKQ